MSAAQLLFLICFLLVAGFIGFACFAFRHALAKDLAKRKAKLAEWNAGAASGDVHAQIMLAWEYARGGVIDRDLRRFASFAILPGTEIGRRSFGWANTTARGQAD
jgi:hypothetical protein